jgi:hypothetical protein
MRGALRSTWLRSTCLRCTWPAVLLLVAGCGDNIQAVYRVYCNVQHEVLDDMMQVVDDESAKRFNTAYENRIMAKEEAVDQRKEKIMNNLFSEADKKLTALVIEEMEAVSLKGQFDSMEARYRLTQNRIRRLIVKMVEDKAEEAKRADQSFTIKSGELCPNLTNMKKGAKFGKSDGGMGGLMGGGIAPPMMPGGGQMPGAGPMPAMPGAGGGVAKKAVDPQANASLEFVMECRRTDDPANRWQVSRYWRAGSARIQELTINGVNLVPLYSVQ